MKRTLLVLFLLLLCNRMFSQSRAYHISSADSRIGFVATKWMVFKEEGRFKQYNGTVMFDPQHPAAMQVSINIQTSSVDSRNTDRDQAIRSLLDTKRFPEMTFRSLSVQQRNRDTLLVTGDLTIRNATKRITVPVRFHGAASVRNVGELAGFETAFTINRHDFGVSDFENLVGKDVEIQLHIGAVAK